MGFVKQQEKSSQETADSISSLHTLHPFLRHRRIPHRGADWQWMRRIRHLHTVSVLQRDSSALSRRSVPCVELRCCSRATRLLISFQNGVCCRGRGASCSVI